MKTYLYIITSLIIINAGCRHNSSADNASTILDPPVDSAVIDPLTPQKAIVINENQSTISSRFAPPIGFERATYPVGTFEHYLTHFPLLPIDEKVHLYDGSEKYYQDSHESILDIDVGNRDLQQCADAIMRLRSEYLYKEKRYNDIAFNFTNGWRFEYPKWRAGNKLIVKGNKTYWTSGEAKKESYPDFRSYLNEVFMYAGTLSLSKELKSKKLVDVEVGDLLIQGGSPGHAVLVVDVCADNKTGDKAIMLAQSYMPAQQIHILKNKANTNTSPWYLLSEINSEIKTPDWTFYSKDLMSFEF